MLRRLVVLCHGFDRDALRRIRRSTEMGVEMRERDGHWHIGDDIMVVPLDLSDLIERRQAVSGFATIWGTLACALRCLFQGFFGEIRRRDRVIWVILMLGLAPPLMLLVALLAALFAFGFAGFAVTLLAAISLIWLSDRFDKTLRSRYVQDIAWAAERLARGDCLDLEARIHALWTDLPPARETVIVGHSLGAAIAARGPAKLPDRGDVTLVTLGQSIPLASLQNGAVAYRQVLEELPEGTQWFDISARKDALGFMAAPPGERAMCISAGFQRSFSARRLNLLKARPLARHYLYFVPPDFPSQGWSWPEFLTAPTPIRDWLITLPRHAKATPRAMRW